MAPLPRPSMTVLQRPERVLPGPGWGSSMSSRADLDLVAAKPGGGMSSPARARGQERRQDGPLTTRPERCPGFRTKKEWHLVTFESRSGSVGPAPTTPLPAPTSAPSASAMSPTAAANLPSVCESAFTGHVSSVVSITRWLLSLRCGVCASLLLMGARHPRVCLDSRRWTLACSHLLAITNGVAGRTRAKHCAWSLVYRSCGMSCGQWGTTGGGQRVWDGHQGTEGAAGSSTPRSQGPCCGSGPRRALGAGPAWSGAQGEHWQSRRKRWFRPATRGLTASEDRPHKVQPPLPPSMS